MLGVLLFGGMLPASYSDAAAAEPSGDAPTSLSASDSIASGKARLQASLLTCSPGAEVYELFGHEAIRIRGIDEKGLPVDTVWNYGVFDFASPNFLYRFVKGETDYMVEPCPMDWFIGAYIHRGSGVTEQDLNLTPQETFTLRRLLQINSLPQNRTYRYNYVRDNCSTRPADMLDAAVAPRRIIYPDSVHFASFRQAMREFHKNYPWYQFGIDLVLGGGIDLPISSREELFSPLLFEQKAASARFEDGEPLVKDSRILYAGPLTGISEPEGMAGLTVTFPDLPTIRQMGSTLPPTPWWLSPTAVGLTALLISIWIGIWQFHNLRIVRWAYSIFFSILGVAGCVVWFLVFFSSHDSTSPNLLSLWLNPLQFVIAVCIWWRVTRPLAVAMAVVDLIAIIALSAVWPLQMQVANPAVFPLWGATFILSLSLIMVRLRQTPARPELKASRRKKKNSTPKK